MTRAEDHFRKGKLNLEDNKREQAREEFDKAIDSILESGFDVGQVKNCRPTISNSSSASIARKFRCSYQMLSVNTQLVAQNTQTQDQKLTACSADRIPRSEV